MLNAAKTGIKHFIAATLWYTGALRVAASVLLRRRAVVLMYHRVLPALPADDVFSSDAIVVSTATFDRHLRLLRRLFRPATAEQLRAMLAGETPWVPRTCVVTFDDGWFDNVEHALPVLEKHGVPATIFVATDFVGTHDTFWQERLARRLLAAWRLGGKAAPVFTGLQATRVLALDEGAARPAIREVVTQLKSRPRAEIDATIARVEEFLSANGAAAAGVGDDRFMTWPQVDSLRRSPVVAVESHAHSHRPLTSLDRTGVERELAESKRALRERLSSDSRFLAYPNGDHDDTVVGAARDAGFALAFTTVPGFVSPGDDPLRLRRINFAEQGTQTPGGFLCRLLAWF